MNTQSFASVLMADSGSKMTDDFEDMVFKAVISEHMNTIIDGGSE